jgi:hypothetical protein
MTNLCRLIANNPKRKIVQLSWLLWRPNSRKKKK